MDLYIWKRILASRYGIPLGMSILLQGALMALTVPLLPIVISDKIGLDKSAVMLYFVVTTIVGMVITLATGYLSDGAIARYKLVLGGGIIAAAGYLGIATATQPFHAFTSGIAISGLTIMFPQLFAVAKAGIVADWEHEDQIMGITALRTLFSLGFIFGTGLSSWMAAAFDIQAAFYVIAGATLALTIYASRVLYRMEIEIADTTHHASKAKNDEVKTRPIILPLYAMIIPLLAITIIQGANSTRGVYLALVMFQIFKDASIAPLMFGITAAAELITMGVMGYLSSKIGEKTTISIGAVVGAVYFVILSTSQSLPLLYAAHILYAVFIAAMLGVAMAYVQNLLAHRAGMGGSLYMAISNVGMLIGILTPLLVNGYDQSIFVIPAFLCILGAIMLMLGDRTAQIEKRLRAEAALEATPLPTAQPIPIAGEV